MVISVGEAYRSCHLEGTKRTEVMKDPADGSSKRHKLSSAEDGSVNGKVASAGVEPCRTRSELCDGEVAPSASALLTAEVTAQGKSTKRLRASTNGDSHQQKCEHVYIGGPEPTVTRYRVRKKSRPGELFKREGE